MIAINILGTDYFIHVGDFPEIDTCDGMTILDTKNIYISGNIINEYFLNVTLRHEIIHAFLFESGLHSCSNDIKCWALNEEMIDFFALQYEKINKTLESCMEQVLDEWRDINA